MSAGKARKFYQELPAVQKKLIDEKTISSTMTIGKWISFLAKAAAYDEMGDKAAKSMVVRAVISFVVAFISIFVTLSGFYYAGILIVIGVIYGIMQLRSRKQLLEKDLNDYLRKFFLPVLDILSKKAGPEAKLSAQLDFRNPAKVQDREKFEAHGRKIQAYSQQFILARVELLDGSRMEFVVSDDFQEQSWTKRTASGKTKYKSKKKTRHVYFIKLTVPRSEYSLSENLPEGVQVDTLDDVYVIKRKGKDKSVESNHILPVNLFLTGVQEIYEALRAKDSKWTDAPRREREDDDDFYDDDYDVAMVVWTGTYFDRYDYHSFEQEGVGAYDYGDADSFFDS